MEKVKLTKEQDWAIKDWLRLFGDKDDLIQRHSELIGRYCHETWLGDYECLKSLTLSQMASALINGYEVDQSPEDKLREYYETVEEERVQSVIDVHSHLTVELTGKLLGIVNTLNILGIKVEGINADKTEGDE